MKPSHGRRTWVKLWVADWLEGTTRYQMSDAQRAFWIDLLAMAGRSRFGGVVCSGKDDALWIGYPLSKFQGLLAEPIDVEATFELFRRTGKITTEVTGDGNRKLYTLFISNWNHYQSEYERKRGEKERRKKRASRPNVPEKSAVMSHSMSPQTTSTEGDVEEEIVGEKEGRRTTATAAAAFQAIGCEPFGDRRFQSVWVREYELRRDGGSWADAMERAIATCKDKGIPVPGRFFDHKHEIEKIEAKNTYKKTPL